MIFHLSAIYFSQCITALRGFWFLVASQILFAFGFPLHVFSMCLVCFIVKLLILVVIYDVHVKYLLFLLICFTVISWFMFALHSWYINYYYFFQCTTRILVKNLLCVFFTFYFICVILIVLYSKQILIVSIAQDLQIEAE